MGISWFWQKLQHDTIVYNGEIHYFLCCWKIDNLRKFWNFRYWHVDFFGLTYIFSFQILAAAIINHWGLVKKKRNVFQSKWTTERKPKLENSNSNKNSPAYNIPPSKIQRQHSVTVLSWIGTAAPRWTTEWL